MRDTIESAIGAVTSRSGIGPALSSGPGTVPGTRFHRRELPPLARVLLSRLFLVSLGGCAVLLSACARGQPRRCEVERKFRKGHVMEMTEIGTIRSPYNSDNRAPRQGALAPDVMSRIVVNERYEEALTDLESFSHIMVLYAFDRSRAWSSMVQTPWDKKKHGLFATRSPNRPNPIGFTVVKLVSREGRTLRVTGLDALDGTPVLDLKPYMAKFDSVDSATMGWFEGLEPEDDSKPRKQE